MYDSFKFGLNLILHSFTKFPKKGNKLNKSVLKFNKNANEEVTNYLKRMIRVKGPNRSFNLHGNLTC